MAADFVTGITELDHYNGHLVRLASQKPKPIPCPMNRAIITLVERWQKKGLKPNPRFLEVIARLYPPSTPLLLGCRSGGRSARAAELLATRGYTKLANVEGGFVGSPMDTGWQPAGLPVRTEPAPGTTWAEIEKG